MTQQDKKETKEQQFNGAEFGMCFRVVAEHYLRTNHRVSSAQFQTDVEELYRLSKAMREELSSSLNKKLQVNFNVEKCDKCGSLEKETVTIDGDVKLCIGCYEKALSDLQSEAFEREAEENYNNINSKRIDAEEILLRNTLELENQDRNRREEEMALSQECVK